MASTLDQFNQILASGNPMLSDLKELMDAPGDADEVAAWDQAGGFGTVGSEETKRAAITYLAQLMRRNSLDSTVEDLIGNATAEFNARTGGPSGQDLARIENAKRAAEEDATRNAEDARRDAQQVEGARRDAERGGFSDGTDPLIAGTAGVKRELPESVSDYQDFLTESQEGRGALFRTAIRGQYPLASPWRDYLESRNDAAEQQYLVQAGIGGTAPSNFSQYAVGPGTKGLNPDLWKAYLQSTSSILTNPPGNMPKSVSGYREYLNDPESGQGRQFNLALQSYLPGVPAPFRGSVARGARRKLEDLTVNQPGQEFLPWFVGRGQRFF